MTKRETLIEAIQALGYKPRTDEDGDLFIRHEMKSLYFAINEEDEDKYVVIQLLKVIDLEPEDVSSALVVCNKLNRDIKLLKTYVHHSFTYISAACEFFYTDMESLKFNVQRSIDILSISRSLYYQAKRELEE